MWTTLFVFTFWFCLQVGVRILTMNPATTLMTPHIVLCLQVGVKAQFKLGDDDSDLLVLLPSVLACRGRIKHEQVWDYVGQLEKSATKKVAITQLDPGNEDADIDLISILTYFSSRQRCGVLNGSGKHGMKDMYLVPVPADQPLHPLLTASSWLKGPGLPADRKQDILLAVFVANSTVKKKSNPPGKKRSSSSSSSSNAHRSSPKYHKTSPSYLRTSPTYSKTPDYMVSPRAGKTPDADDALDRPYSPSQDDGLLDRPYSPSGDASSGILDRPYSPSADVAAAPTTAYGKSVNEAANAARVASAAGDNVESLFDMLETLNKEPPALAAVPAPAPATQAPRAVVPPSYQAAPAKAEPPPPQRDRYGGAQVGHGGSHGSSGPPTGYGGGYGGEYAQQPAQQQQQQQQQPYGGSSGGRHMEKQASSQQSSSHQQYDRTSNYNTEPQQQQDRYHGQQQQQHRQQQQHGQYHQQQQHGQQQHGQHHQHQRGGGRDQNQQGQWQSDRQQHNDPRYRR
jgi:hypothetical protein